MNSRAALNGTTRVGIIGRVVLVAGVAFGAMPILGANPAYACSCLETDEQRQYDEATHVFKGSLPEGPPEQTGDQDQGAGTVTYTFDVLDTYKGTVGDPQKVSTASQSATCGVDLDGTGPFLVFAHDAAENPTAEAPAAEDPVLTMNLCGGTRPIGLNDQPTFGKAPEGAQPAEPAAEPEQTAEPDQADEQGTVGLVVSKLSGYLAELLGPLKTPAQR